MPSRVNWHRQSRHETENIMGLLEMLQPKQNICFVGDYLNIDMPPVYVESA